MPLLVDLFYYLASTGCGKRTLGEAYSNIVPVDIEKKQLFLANGIGNGNETTGMRTKRIVWVLLSVLLPHILKNSTNGRAKEILDILFELKSVLFYWSGKFPSFTNQFLSIRHVRFSRGG